MKKISFRTLMYIFHGLGFASAGSSIILNWSGGIEAIQWQVNCMIWIFASLMANLTADRYSNMLLKGIDDINKAVEDSKAKLN